MNNTITIVAVKTYRASVYEKSECLVTIHESNGQEKSPRDVTIDQLDFEIIVGPVSIQMTGSPRWNGSHEITSDQLRRIEENEI